MLLRSQRCTLITLAFLGASGQIAHAQGGAGQPIASQKSLDLLATFPIPGTASHAGAPYLPKGNFASWTDEQKRTVPASLTQTCMIIWTMAHDSPDTRFLPTSSSDASEMELGVDLCLSGHMPADWPERRSKLQAASTILDVAKQAGSSLQLPPTLKR